MVPHVRAGHGMPAALWRFQLGLGGDMRRLLAIMGAVAIMAAAPSFALGQSKDKAPAEKAPASKSMTAAGNVTAVVADSMTVKGKTAEWTFMIDKDTTVVAKGATHKSLALKAEGKGQTLPEFVKVGDEVSVTYKEMGTAKHASTIRVVQATTKK
jgi:hypothetical protein